jgi:hypothetical protein
MKDLLQGFSAEKFDGVIKQERNAADARDSSLGDGETDCQIDQASLF